MTNLFVCILVYFFMKSIFDSFNIKNIIGIMISSTILIFGFVTFFWMLFMFSIAYIVFNFNDISKYYLLIKKTLSNFLKLSKKINDIDNLDEIISLETLVNFIEFLESYYLKFHEKYMGLKNYFKTKIFIIMKIIYYCIEIEKSMCHALFNLEKNYSEDNIILITDIYFQKYYKVLIKIFNESNNFSNNFNNFNNLENKKTEQLEDLNNLNKMFDLFLSSIPENLNNNIHTNKPNQHNYSNHLKNIEKKSKTTDVVELENFFSSFEKAIKNEQIQKKSSVNKKKHKKI